MKTIKLLGAILIVTCGLSLKATAHPQSLNGCESEEQTETLAKIEKCVPPGSGNGALSSANFDDAITFLRTRLFVRCLSQAYEISKTDPSAQIYWSTVQMGIADYFKFNLTSDRNQNNRCALASTLNSLIQIGTAK